MSDPSLLKHLRDILILPFTVTVIVPYFLTSENKYPIVNHFIFTLLGAIIFLLGLALFIYTVALFRSIGKGTLAPWSEKQKLIITGPYRHSRNPMISGVLFILIGETLFLHNEDILIWTIIFFITNNVYFLLKEEPDLEKKFGDEYHTYKKAVPRWIPRIKPYNPTDIK
jgi:protein-S-isoprenylcysteine O-methyltransferase Ste14